MTPTASNTSRCEPCLAPTQLREASDALDESSKTRRNLCATDAQGADIHRLIAERYERTARVFKDIVRILERDQTVLQPRAPQPAVPSEPPCPAVKPTCAECGSESVSADAAARWSMDLQDWETSAVYDKGTYCDDCESIDIDLVWVEVQSDAGGTERVDMNGDGPSGNHPLHDPGDFPMKAPSPRAFSVRETANLVAALRYWQREGLLSGGHENDIATEGGTLHPLSTDEIDALCGHLNQNRQKG